MEKLAALLERLRSKKTLARMAHGQVGELAAFSASDGQQLKDGKSGRWGGYGLSKKDRHYDLSSELDLLIESSSKMWELPIWTHCE